MGKSKDLSDSDKGLIVVARWLGQSILKMAGLRKRSKEAQLVNRQQALMRVGSKG